MLNSNSSIIGKRTRPKLIFSVHDSTGLSWSFDVEPIDRDQSGKQKEEDKAREKWGSTAQKAAN